MILFLFAIVAVSVLVMRFIARPFIYDFFIVNMTRKWYRVVLERVSIESHILDVGIGTGTALFRNKELMTEKKIRVTGVDYDSDYIALCEKTILQEKLDQQVNVHAVSIYDYKGGPFDAAYFSGSLMIMPDPVRALRHVCGMLKPGGLIYVTQTFETRESRVLEYVKPLLKFLTTIDFGNVTYEKDFLKSFQEAEIDIIENVPIAKSSLSSGSFRLIVAKPRTSS